MWLRPVALSRLPLDSTEDRAFLAARRECVAPCGHPLCNAFCAKMTQSLIKSQLNALRSALELCNPSRKDCGLGAAGGVHRFVSKRRLAAKPPVGYMAAT
jgi:hypothetical protein